jgi:hypothetical protein
MFLEGTMDFIIIIIIIIIFSVQLYYLFINQLYAQYFYLSIIASTCFGLIS